MTLPEVSSSQLNWVGIARAATAILHLAEFLSWPIGVVLVIGGLYRLAGAQTRREPPGTGIARIVAGILLVGLPSFLDKLSETFVGQHFSPLAYAPPSGAGSTAEIVGLLLYVVEIVGLIAVIRGIILLARAFDGNDDVGTAIVFLLAGTMALNVRTVLTAVAHTVGGGVAATIRNLIGS